ncbi:hypothetical protein GCM10022243_50640 [Saccharothrix violaceirubra]
MVLALLLTGCASGNALPPAGSNPTTTPVEPSAAPGTSTPPGFAPVDTGFPVTATPRPIVMPGGRLGLLGDFSEAQREAARRHAFKLSTTVQAPQTPGPQEIFLPTGEKVTTRVIDAAEAYQAMTSLPDDPTAIEIVEIERIKATVTTDRGRIDIPAWSFHLAGGGEVTWPAIDPSLFWNPDNLKATTLGNGAIAQGSTLTVVLPDAPAPCPGHQPATNEAVAVESDLSVTLSVKTVGDPGECVRTQEVKTKKYKIELSKPVGNRLVLDTGGGVFDVATAP